MRGATPPSEVEVRLAGVEDLAALAASGFGRHGQRRDRLDRQRSGLGELLVAWLDGQPVGELYLWRGPHQQPELLAALPDVPIVEHIEVTPGQRRRGLGTALLGAAERLAAAHGDLLCVAIPVDNPGRVLLERRGYEDWGHGLVQVGRDDCRILLKIVNPKLPGFDAWRAWTPEEVAQRLDGCEVPWCVAAGWALDLFRGSQTRDHEDTEIAVPQDCFGEVAARLADCAFYVPGNGRLVPVTPEALWGHHQTWALERASGKWRLDIFREPHDGDIWICRRDERIRKPYAEIIEHDSRGIPFLVPEIVLLFKAHNDRDKDRTDLRGMLPLLDDRRRHWLRASVAQVHPGHPWLEII